MKNRKLPEEILTKEDIKKMIDAARTPRDRAIISVLYESGCRVGEFLSMRIKNVSFDRYGAVIVVHGKTGYRRIRLVSSVPYLAEWMNSHPFSEDPEAWLWISLNNFRRLPYNFLRTILRVIAKKARWLKSFAGLRENSLNKTLSRILKSLKRIGLVVKATYYFKLFNLGEDLGKSRIHPKKKGS